MGPVEYVLENSGVCVSSLNLEFNLSRIPFFVTSMSPLQLLIIKTADALQ